MNDEEVRRVLTRKIKAMGLTVRAWCVAHDLDPCEVSRVFHGHVKPTRRVLAALGMRKVVSYEYIPRR